ncbi:MAG: phosphatidylglycerophosphatase A [Saprospiraceae bacterium]|nr:phosphatidylglycerophosphatase A [Saprospiraceae bacterium]
MSETKSIYKWLATFGGVGYMPKAPGTFGALAALLLVWLLSFFVTGYNNQQILLWFLILSSYVLGIISVRKLMDAWGDDPSKVVIDEACGLWISLLFLPFTALNFILAFILFRFFDILKPLGIRKLDNMKVLKAHGVMLDDVLAGVYSCFVIHLIHYLI